MDTSRTSAHSREPLVAGVVLVVVGAVLLVGQLVPDLSRYLALAVGLVLLAAFAVRRDYGLLVAGGIVTGVGTGIVLASSLTGDLAGGSFMLALGSGFLGVGLISYLLRIEERHWWPFIPGGVLVAIGAAIATGGAAFDLLSMWPLVLIVIGVALLGSWLLSMRRAS